MRFYSFKKLMAKQRMRLAPADAWKRDYRETLLAEIRKDPVWQNAPSTVRSSSAFARLFSSLFAQAVVKPAVAFVLIFAVVSYSSVFTVQAAKASLPGEALYSVKLGIERAQVGVAFSESKKAELEISFATTRLNEVNEILSQGNQENSKKPNQNANIEQAMKHFNTDLGSVQKRLEKLQSQEDSQETVLKISKLVNEKTTELEENLLVIKEKLTEVEAANQENGNAVAPGNATTKQQGLDGISDAATQTEGSKSDTASLLIGGIVATSTTEQAASSSPQVLATSTPNSVSSEPKSAKPELLKTVNNALAAVDQTNTKSLEMFVENAQASKSGAVQQDAVDKVQKKINKIEKAIDTVISEQAAASLVSGQKSSTISTSSAQSATKSDSKSAVTPSEAPQQIKDVIDAAKKILDGKDINELGRVVDKVKEIKAITQDASGSDSATAKDSKDTKIPDTSTPATSTPSSLNQKINTDGSVLGATTVQESIKANNQ